MRSTQHSVSNRSFEIAGDRACEETYSGVFFVHDDGSLVQLLIRYVDQFARRDGRWFITRRTPLVEWTNDEALALRIPLSSRRDRDDRSYRGPG